MTQIAEVDGVRIAMAALRTARDLRHARRHKRDELQADIDKLRADRRAADESLAAAETAIALSCEVLPDEPAPEEAEIRRIDRHTRILQARMRVFEQEVAAADRGVAEAEAALEAEWRRLGVARTQEIRERYRNAASELRASLCEYLAWAEVFRFGRHEAETLPSKNPFSAPPQLPEVFDLNGSPLFNGQAVKLSNHFWHKEAGDLLHAIYALRAEIDEAEGKSRPALATSDGITGER